VGDNKGSIFLLGGLGLFLIFVIYMIANASGTTALDRSAIGTKGLVEWLKANDEQVIEAHRRVSLSESDVDLRILPLNDVDLLRTSFPADSREEQLAQTTQRNIDQYVLIDKMDYVPTLLMMPKWRTGTIMLDVAHEQLLIPFSNMETVMDQLGIGRQRIIRPEIKLLETTLNETGGPVTLYQPQLFQTKYVNGVCNPVLSIPEGVLVMTCTSEDGIAHSFLSDPDLMNNHGLALGNNSAVALEVIAMMRRGTEGAIYHDTSDDILLSWQDTREVEQRPRTTEDVSRYWEYPFTLIWLAIAFAFVIAAWRGLVRFGPAAKPFDDTIGASKTASIEAKAYLLRLTGQDHALLAEYADNKLNDLARDLYGKGVGKDRTALFNRLNKIAPKSAGDLVAATNRMITTTSETSPSELSKIMQEFDLSYRSISDELGRISRTR